MDHLFWCCQGWGKKVGKREMAENSLKKKSNLADSLMKVLVPIRHVQIAFLLVLKYSYCLRDLFNLRTGNMVYCNFFLVGITLFVGPVIPNQSTHPCYKLPYHSQLGRGATKKKFNLVCFTLKKTFYCIRIRRKGGIYSEIVPLA